MSYTEDDIPIELQIKAILPLDMASNNHKQISIDGSILYVYKPSVFMVNGENVLNTLEIYPATENIDCIDTFIFNLFINSIIDGRNDLDQLISSLEEYLKTHNIYDFSLDKDLIKTYYGILESTLYGIARPYIDGYVDVKTLDNIWNIYNTNNTINKFWCFGYFNCYLSNNTTYLKIDIHKYG